MKNISKLIFGIICLIAAVFIGFGDKFGKLINKQDAQVNHITPSPIDNLIDKIGVSNNKFTSNDTAAILNTLSVAESHGLKPIDLSQFNTTIKEGKRLTPEQESKLTELLIKYANQMSGSRINWSKANKNWDMAPQNRDFSAEIETVRQNNPQNKTMIDWLNKLSPQSENYKGLMAARTHYHAIVANGGFTRLGSLQNLKLGAVSEKVPLLRQRLAEEGYAAIIPTDPNYFDGALKQQLILFQEAHGAMKPDGEIGEITLNKLNISAEEKLKQIDLNLERERWLPRDNPQTRLEANIPSAELNYFVNGNIDLNMPTIVGAIKTKTPIFVSNVHTIVLNPPWYVPRSIKSRVRVYPPGPRNALGRVKFDLINKHSVYLHDTPNHYPFAGKMRALSHGCVRLDRPKDLAEKLLAPEGITRDKIEEITQTVKTTRFKLTNTTPVYLLYRTAQYEKLSNGTMAIHFYKDIYNWDEELNYALHPELKPKTDVPEEIKTAAAP